MNKIKLDQIKFKWLGASSELWTKVGSKKKLQTTAAPFASCLRHPVLMWTFADTNKQLRGKTTCLLLQSFSTCISLLSQGHTKGIGSLRTAQLIIVEEEEQEEEKNKDGEENKITISHGDDYTWKADRRLG